MSAVPLAAVLSRWRGPAFGALSEEPGRISGVPVRMAVRRETMAIEEDLLGMERGFWSGGADYCRQNLDDPYVPVILEENEIAAVTTETSAKPGRAAGAGLR